MELLPNATLTDGMHLMVDALRRNGVETIFGVVGIPVTDLARHAQEVGIRYIGFRHEQSAGNAAAVSGYLTQKPGICLTVSAPGFLNGLTALACATQNGFPMIQISGSSDRNIIDLQQGDYEGLDQMNVAKPFAKAAFERPVFDLSAEEFDAVCSLATAPVVEMLVSGSPAPSDVNPLLKDRLFPPYVWQRVNIAPGTFARGNQRTTPNTYSIEFIVELPERHTPRL